MKHSPTLELAQQLISQQSVTPNDAECQKILTDRLKPLGFNCEGMRFGDVDNLWARRGTDSPLLVFAGHTDVVPTGPIDEWTHPPFAATVDGDYLYGRGAADMKGSIAAMICAIEAFLQNKPDHKGSIALLITSDEEGPAVDGTIKVVDTLQARSEHIDWCIVGEPSSSDTLGDIIKNGRRGSLNGVLTISGKQGHVAYPHLAKNPIHAAAPALSELCGLTWDEGNEFFPPTTFQISNINSGTGAGNVIPGELRCQFNFRFSTETTVEELRTRAEATLAAHGLDFTVDWKLSGNPFITQPAELTKAAIRSIRTVGNIEPTLSTGGGTSDGRFIAPTGAQVIELGPVNATIHQINERVGVEELNQLTEMYRLILEDLL